VDFQQIICFRFPILLLNIIMIGKVVPEYLKIVKIQQKIVSKMLKSQK